MIADSSNPSVAPIDGKYSKTEIIIPNGSSNAKAVFNLVMTAIGLGVMTLPMAFGRAGWISGSILLIVSAGFVYYNVIILCHALCLNPEDPTRVIQSFEELGRICYGRLATVMNSVTLHPLLIAACAVFLILLSTSLYNMTGVLSYNLWLLIISLSIAPFACLRTMKEVGVLSAIGVASVAAIVVLVVLASLDRYINGASESLGCLLSRIGAGHSLGPASAAVLAGTGGKMFKRMISNMSASLGDALYNSPPTKVTTLPNGLRVATQHTFTESATIGVWIDAGSRYETKETNGTAHFLEHLAFKGTQRRTRLQLEREVEDIGAHLNAYTSREQTVYYAKTRRECVGQGLDILSDILQHSKLERRAIEEERGVILREMEEVNKSLEEVIYDQLHIACFREDPLGYTILGPVENIRSINRDNLVNYISNNYKADRMVVAAAGPVDHEEIVKCAAEKFGNLPKSSGPRASITKPRFVSSELLSATDALGPSSHVAVAFEGVPWTSPDCITFMLMQQIVGGFNGAFQGLIPPTLSANSSIQAIARAPSEEGAATWIDSFTALNTCYKDTGLFGFYVASPEEKINNAIDELMCSIDSLSYSITEEDLERAKKQLLTTLFIGLDDTTGVAEDIGRQLLVYGRRISPAEFVKRLDQIDHYEIRRVAQKYLLNKPVTMTGVGMVQNVMQLSEVQKLAHWQGASLPKEEEQ
ncbi:mitochondrial processing peptidase beta subunit [Perkinsus chesapeaki]|uniref:Mitochondrial processing peptidase beta subunit n=1 Tax=Perkinsus chesapeaki TaxID=330153 RepID=A0A7J6LIW4_PERCH|nr:mitochondrial processing peptidase beta subunit [Perkinsus chesapeaki]